MYYSEDLKLPVSKMVLRYAENIQKNNQAKNEEKRFVGTKLCRFRNEFYEYLQSLEDGNPDKNDMIERIFFLSNALGRTLTSLNEWKLARKAFKSVQNASMVVKIFEA